MIKKGQFVPRKTIYVGIEPDPDLWELMLEMGDWKVFENWQESVNRWIKLKAIYTKPVKGKANYYLSYSEVENRFANTPVFKAAQEACPEVLDAIAQRIQDDAEAWQKENQ
jgi:hypothetical protein